MMIMMTMMTLTMMYSTE